MYKRYKSSAECKKVVSGIFGEIELLTLFESTGRMTHLELYGAGLKSKVFTFVWKKQDVKNNKAQNKSEYEITIPAKGRKCTCDFIAFS